jgi:hypothetical protein
MALKKYQLLAASHAACQPARWLLAQLAGNEMWRRSVEKRRRIMRRKRNNGENG